MVDDFVRGKAGQLFYTPKLNDELPASENTVIVAKVTSRYWVYSVAGIPGCVSMCGWVNDDRWLTESSVDSTHLTRYPCLKTGLKSGRQAHWSSSVQYECWASHGGKHEREDDGFRALTLQPPSNRNHDNTPPSRPSTFHRQNLRFTASC